MKKIYRDKKASVHWSTASNEERSLSNDKLRINRWSNGRIVPSAVYMGFPLFLLAKKRPEQLFTVRWRAREAVGFEGDRKVGTLFCPASPCPAVRPAPCRPDLPVVCPGFGLDRFKPREEPNKRLPVYHWFMTVSWAGGKGLLVPGCRPVERRLFVPIYPFHEWHVGEPFPCRVRR